MSDIPGIPDELLDKFMEAEAKYRKAREERDRTRDFTLSCGSRWEGAISSSHEKVLAAARQQVGQHLLEIIVSVLESRQ